MTSNIELYYRYGFTVLANLAVSLSMWQLLDHVKNGDHSSSSSSGNTTNNGSSVNKINTGDKGLFWVQWLPLSCSIFNFLLLVCVHWCCWSGFDLLNNIPHWY